MLSVEGKMLSCLIGESSNDDPSHHHGGFDATDDQGSSVVVGGIIAIADVVATTRPNIRVDEAESPLPIPPTNVINLDSKTTTVHVIPPCLVIYPSSLFPKKT